MQFQSPLPISLASCPAPVPFRPPTLRGYCPLSSPPPPLKQLSYAYQYSYQEMIYCTGSNSPKQQVFVLGNATETTPNSLCLIVELVSEELVRLGKWSSPPAN